MPNELQFTLGADPEFNITLYDKKISAKKVIESMFRKDNATSTERDEFQSDMGFRIPDAGVLGWDGCDATAEIRPNPSNTVEGLTNNIGRLIEELAKKSPSFDLSVISNKGSVGGHIHFSLPRELVLNPQKQLILHKQMTSYYLPIMMGENKLNLKIRNKSSYGKLQDFRVDNKKNATNQNEVTTYEFRVPSAEWINSPKICQSTLAYLATIYNEIIFHQDNIKKNKEILYKTEKQGEALQNLALSDYTFLTNVLLNKIRKSIKTFELYETYKEEIEYILNPTKVLKDKEKVEFNLLYGWNLNKSKPPTKEDLLNTKLINDKSLNIDIDEMIKLIWIGYNDDVNVSNFVKEIKKRIITVKWKLENEYFIFGMKKGISDYIIMNKDLELIKGHEVIKTEEDTATINTVFQRVKNKMNDIMNNKLSDKKRIILIGVPYEERIKENYKKFIETIYNLEKNWQATEINRKNLIADRLLENANKGEIFKIYNNKNNQNIENLRQDRNREDQQERLVREVNEENSNGNMFLDEAPETEPENEDFDEEDPCDGCDGDCEGCEHHNSDED